MVNLLTKKTEYSSTIKSFSFFNKIKANRQFNSSTKSLIEVPEKVEKALKDYQLISQK